MVFIIEEKRRFPRVKLQTPLRFQFFGKTETGNAIAENVSLGGTGFTNHQFIAPATLLNLEVSVLSKVLSLRGKIAWSSPLPHSDRYRSGVEFTDLTEKDKGMLSDYIDLQMLNA